MRLAAREALIAEAVALGAPSHPGPGATSVRAQHAQVATANTDAAEPSGSATAEGDGTASDAHAGDDSIGGQPEAPASEAHAATQADAAPPGSPAPVAAADRVAAVRSLRTRWANAPVLPRDVLAPLAQRFEAALSAAVGADPDAVRGTEFDVSANLRRLQDLVARAEKLAGPEPARGDAASPASILAMQLREALAANTIGGRGDDEAKLRTAEHEIRQLQASWTQVGFVPEAQARPLALRFQRACQRFFDQREQRRRALAGRP